MNQKAKPELNRRDFLKNSSITAMTMLMMGAIELKAEDKPKAAQEDEDEKIKNPIKCAVIGCGVWGREILSSLARIEGMPVVAICDTYEPMMNRAARSAPNAKKIADYKQVLDDKDVQAVIIATPSHMHKEIAVAALQAGKHVYCEAPIATTIDDAKAIATAAKNAKKQIFQAGLILRSNPIHKHVVQFVRTNALGTPVISRAQFHKKQSWRVASPNAEREKAANWRLSKETSLGLAGEIGIHHYDVTCWYYKTLPVAVNGFGEIIKWKDGRDVADTIQTILEFPGGLKQVYDATLANSFEGSYEIHFGTDAAIYIRDSRAWIIKETDAPLLGWEVYARKEDFLPSKESGITLVANATKLLAQGKEPAETTPDTDSPLFYAMKEFGLSIDKNTQPGANFEAAFTSAVIAIKTSEAINGNKRVELPKELFEI
jgi:predicted dehydrogenase